MISARRHPLFSRLVGMTFTIAAASQLLNSCFEDAPSADLVFGSIDGVVAVTNCGPLIKGPVELRIGETTDEFENFFLASRAAGWKRGETLTTDPGEWDDVERNRVPTLAPESQVAVRVFADGKTLVARFGLPKRGLVDGGWIRPDGTVSREACET